MNYIQNGDQVHVYNKRGEDLGVGIAKIYGLGFLALVNVLIEIKGVPVRYTFRRSSAYRNPDGATWRYDI